jgi:hypothetical protein
MASLIRIMAVPASIAAWPAAALAHPDISTGAGLRTYLISSVVTAALVAGCVLASRLGRRRKPL